MLDEPTAHLDADNAAELCIDLLAVTQGGTALIVTHRLDELPELPSGLYPHRGGRLSRYEMP